MSGDRLIDPLSPLITDDLTLPLQPDFTSLVTDTLGNSGDPTDGFDQVLTDLIGIVDSLEGGLATLGGADGGDLDDTFVDILALDADAPGVDVANLTAALPDVQTNVDNLGNLLAAAALPAPPAGGGGGGGTPPAGGCAVVQFGKVNEYTGGVFTHLSATFTLQNNTQNTLTIKAATWSVVLANILSVTPALAGQTIAPGASLSFTIVFTAAGDGLIDSTLTIQTDGPDPQPCIEVKAEIIPGSPSGPGAGPSGPQPQSLRVG